MAGGTSVFIRNNKHIKETKMAHKHAEEIRAFIELLDKARFELLQNITGIRGSKPPGFGRASI